MSLKIRLQASGFRRQASGVRRRGWGGASGGRAFGAVLGALLLVGVGGCGGGEDALARGDRLWADSAFTQSLAEYRLARAGGGGEEALRRLAHAYAVTGQLEPARETYRLLLAEDPEHTDQAIFDFLAMARQARARGDAYGMTRAAESALELRPGIDLGELSDAMARYYMENASAERALAYYERALAKAPPDSAATLMLRIGTLRAEEGRCEAALPYLRAYLERSPGASGRSDARWHIGNCSHRLAREAHQAGNLTAALERLETVIGLGVPTNLQDQAWFLRAEILFALGRNDEALEAYRRVLELNPERTGQLVEKAQTQIDRIRFGEF